jgi:hypothetical protein
LGNEIATFSETNGAGVDRVAHGDWADVMGDWGDDLRRIAYLPPSEHRQTVHVRPPGAIGGGKHFDDYGFRRALELL